MALLYTQLHGATGNRDLAPPSGEDPGTPLSPYPAPGSKSRGPESYQRIFGDFLQSCWSLPHIPSVRSLCVISARNLILQRLEEADWRSWSKTTYLC
jgi:hypothetical protein